MGVLGRYFKAEKASENRKLHYQVKVKSHFQNLKLEIICKFQGMKKAMKQKGLPKFSINKWKRKWKGKRRKLLQDSELELAYSFELYDEVHEMMHVDRRFNNNEKWLPLTIMGGVCHKLSNSFNF